MEIRKLAESHNKPHNTKSVNCSYDFMFGVLSNVTY